MLHTWDGQSPSRLAQPFQGSFRAAKMAHMGWTNVGMLWTLLLMIIAGPTFGTATAHAAADGDPNALFENRIRPVLTAHCVKCHGADKQESGLRLDTKSLANKGGDRGPAILSGDPEHSLIVQAIRKTGELKMPPDESLRPEEVAGVVDWIRHGLPWPADAAKTTIRDGSITEKDRQFWSFGLLVHAAPPGVRDSAWLESPVDRFILARSRSGILQAGGSGRQAHADPAGHFRSHRPAPAAGGHRCVSRG